MEIHRRPVTDCAAIAVDDWAQECRFQFAERAALQGNLDDAFAACDGTPEFGRECSYHLIRQAVRRVKDKTPAEVNHIAAPYAKLKRAPDAEKLFWRAWFREQLADRVVIDPTSCPSDACRAAARDEMSLHLPGVRRATPEFCTIDPALLGSSVWAHTELTNAWVAEWRVQPCLLGQRPPLRPPVRPPGE